MSFADVLKQLPAAFDPNAAAGTQCVVQFNASIPAYATIKGGACTITEGVAPSPDITLTMGDEDFVQLFTGRLNGLTAFMSGKLQLDGDIMLAQRMMSFFDPAKVR